MVNAAAGDHASVEWALSLIGQHSLSWGLASLALGLGESYCHRQQMGMWDLGKSLEVRAMQESVMETRSGRIEAKAKGPRN